MTTLPFTLAIDPAPTQFLLTVRGTSAATDRETVRKAHNMAAGSDQGVAAARSLRRSQPRGLRARSRPASGAASSCSSTTGTASTD